jgi:phage shock protein A
MDHWISLARQLVGKRPANDDMEIAVQAIVELAKQCSDLKSWIGHLEQKIKELERKQSFAKPKPSNT